MRERPNPRLSLVIVAIGCTLSGCGIVGPTCLSRQKTGLAATASGHVEPGQVATHLLPYDLNGSQNDVNITWSAQGQTQGPRLRIYATTAACASFVPPTNTSDAPRGDCAIISRGGGYIAPDARPCARNASCQPNPDEIVNTSLIVTGPGNGAPAGFHEYKVHIVGDPTRAADYSVTATWFFGPDC
jgi:hypothetical protein